MIKHSIFIYTRMKVITNWPSEIPLSETLGNEWTLTLITLLSQAEMSNVD